MKDWVLKNHYQILGVSPYSSEAQIKQAYRRLVRENHPDYNPRDPIYEERLREINASYEALTNRKTRRMVDFWLSGIKRPNVPHTNSTYAFEDETPFSYKMTLIQEWNSSIFGFKLFALFCLPTAFYLILGQWESLHIALNIFVIVFVGTFYIALFFGAKAIFHGTTVLVMKVSKRWRQFVQIMIPIFLFLLPLHYFLGNNFSIEFAIISFKNHTWDWFLFAAIIIGLTWLFGIFFKSPLASRFPFRLNMLAVFLTFVIAFCKAVPLTDKSEVLFEYVFLNLTMQIGLILAIRYNHKNEIST